MTRLVAIAALFAALPVAIAQTVVAPLTGAYGFQVAAAQIDSAGSNGGALIGILNFDGSGNITGTFTFQGRNGFSNNAPGGSSTLNGTYQANPDGTGAMSLSFPDLGFDTTLAFVLSDGGKTISFIDAPSTVVSNTGVNATLRGPLDGPFTGTLPVNYFIPRGSGTIPITLNRTFNNGVTVFTSAPATTSGNLQCADNSTPPFTLSIPSVTVALANAESGLAGNFFLSALGVKCDGDDFETYSGFANILPNANGSFNLVLRLTGGLTPGSARWIGTPPATLSGNYGGLAIGSPFPGGQVTIDRFDPSGTVTANLTSIGGSGDFAGTYTLNPDGSGTMLIKPTANPSATPTSLSFVAVDNGSTLLYLRSSSSGAGGNVLIGSMRAQ